MYTPPDTFIKILKDVPLDLTYDHTIWFPKTQAGKTLQTDYFASKAKYTLSNQSYQRVQRGWIRVNIKAENLYDCNYLMFQNHAFGTKWFYAFIKSVEYINDNVAQIEFSIDVMQTWYFDYELEQCFVEREHQESDEIGDNLVPENLELGDYVGNIPEPTGLMDGYKIIVGATFSPINFEDDFGWLYADVYSGLNYYAYDSTAEGVNTLRTMIQAAGAKADGIVCIFYAPTSFVVERNEHAKIYTLNKTKAYTSIDGYTPKNKKLFTYPYNFLYVTNLQGKSAVFPYEYFSTDSCNFSVQGDFSANTTILLIPKYYKGATSNYDELLTLNGFAQCSYNTDVFKAWLAQSTAALPFSAVGQAAHIGSSIFAANAMAKALGTASATASASIAPVVGGVAAAGFIANYLGQVAQHDLQPPQSHGTQAGNTLTAFKLLDFYFINKHIRAEFARIIDDYFTCYGYACHRVKVPNIRARPHWTYTKTVGCTIVGSLPCDDMKTICGIYDNGITFWVNPSEIGDYSLDNRPTLGPNP